MEKVTYYGVAVCSPDGLVMFSFESISEEVIDAMAKHPITTMAFMNSGLLDDEEVKIKRYTVERKLFVLED